MPALVLLLALGQVPDAIVWSIRLESGFPRCLAFSPDSNRFAVGDNKGKLHIYDCASRQTLSEKQFAGKVDRLAYSPTGELLLVAVYDPAVRQTRVLLLDTVSGEMKGERAYDGNVVRFLCFSHDERLLIGLEKAIDVCHYRSGVQPDGRIDLPKSFSRFGFDEITFVDAGTAFVTQAMTSANKSVALKWDWKTREVVAQIGPSTGVITHFSLSHSSDLLCMTGDRAIEVVHVPTFTSLRTLVYPQETSVRHGFFLRNDRYLVTFGDPFFSWDFPAQQPLILQLPPKTYLSIWSYMSPDRRLIAFLNGSCVDVIATDRLTLRRPQSAVDFLRVRGFSFETSDHGEVVSVFRKAATDEDLLWMRYLPKLEAVEIDGQEVTSTGLLHLGQLEFLRDLTLTCSIEDSLALLPLKDLKRLQKLHLTCRNLRDLRAMSHLTGLEELHLDAPNTAAGEFIHLGKCRNLWLLNLSSYRARNGAVDDQVIAVIAKLPRLKALGLRQTAVTDDGIGHLLQRRALEHLDLSDTSISNRSIDTLEQLRDLKELSLHNTRVTAAGLQRLRKALPNCKVSGDE